MQNITKTTRVATAVSKLTGRGWIKFNDKLKDGTRSLKVIGWTDKDYTEAAKLLRLMGCKVDIVGFDAYNFRAGRSYKQTRLHVKETA